MEGDGRIRLVSPLLVCVACVTSLSTNARADESTAAKEDESRKLQEADRRAVGYGTLAAVTAAGIVMTF